jgi:hypothetical protein
MITIIIITIIIILINKLDKIISKQNTNDSIKSINKPIESIDTDKFNNKYTKKTDILNTEKLFDINKIDHKFLEWLSGFTDAEGNFTIVLKYKSNMTKTAINLNSVGFYYGIALHIDDIDTLYYIKNKLNIGNVSILDKEDLCLFSVTRQDEIDFIIKIFTVHKLNTIKWLDFMDFKEAYSLYVQRPYNSLYLNIDILNIIIALKSKMNNSRTNFELSSYNNNSWDNHIVIRPLWLLGFVEGDGSFNIWRENIDTVFAIVQTEKQKLVLMKIKDYLLNNLGFCEYSLIKLNTSKGIVVKYQKGRNKSKPTYMLLIKDIRIIHNYVIPYFNNMRPYFITKKLKDFEDLILVSNAVYYGVHRHKEIRDLIIRLSYNINSYSLSTFLKSKLYKNIVYNPLTDDERSLINDYILNKPLTKHLWDGRTINLETNQIIFNNESSLYKILSALQGCFTEGETHEIIYVNTLTECSKIIGVNIKTLSKYLDKREIINEEDYYTEINNFKIKRIGVYYKNIIKYGN